MKLTLLLIPLILLSSCIKQEVDISQNTDKFQSGSEQISYHSGYEIHHENDGSTTLIAGSEKNTCPPGMYPKWLDGCVKDPLSCTEWQAMTGFPGSQYCENITDDPRSYYEKLWSRCAEDSFWYAGCAESIDYMKAHWYRLPLSETCPENFKIDWYTVDGWLTWCAPNDIYYQNLRATCGEESCCLSSVAAMEQWRYLEASDGKCTDRLLPNMQRCPTSKIWCQYNFLAKDFWSGFTLRQNDTKTELFLWKWLIRNWSNKSDTYPFFWEGWCKVMFNLSMRKTPNPTNSSDPISFPKYIWSTFSPEEKTSCMKEYYTSNIKVKPYNDRFISIEWANHTTYVLSIFDTLTGNMHDFFSDGDGDTLESIRVGTWSIEIDTKFTKRVDPTQYMTIFDESFSGVTSVIVSD